MSLAWSCDPDDPRVIEALKHACPACGTKKGRCLMLKQPLVGGRIVHQIRVPEDLLLGGVA